MPEPAGGQGHLLPRRLTGAGASLPESASTPEPADTSGSTGAPGDGPVPDAAAPAVAEPQPLAAGARAGAASPDRLDDPEDPGLVSDDPDAGEVPAARTVGAEPPSGASSSGPPRLRRRRPLRWLVAVSVLLVLVLGGCLALNQAERTARRTVQEQVLAAVPGLSADAAVELGPGRVLPQLWDGELRGFTVTASSLQVGAGAAQAQGLSEPLTLSGIRVQVTGMGTESPHQARALQAGGSLSWEQVSSLAAAHLEGGGSSAAGVVTGVELQQVEGGSPDSLLVVVDVPVATFEAKGTLSISQQGDLLLSLSEVEVSSGPLPGVGVPDDETFLETVGVPQTITVLPAGELPEGLRVESVETSAAGVTVVLSGQDLALDGLGR